MRVKLVKLPELPSVELPDDAPLSALLDAVAKAAGRSAADVSILCKGKRLDAVRGGEPLVALGVSDGTTAIVMLRAGAAEAVRTVDALAASAAARRAQLEKAAEAARLISANAADDDDDDDGHTATQLEIFDQRGKPVEMPDVDRRGLTLGYLLHAKAKALLARAQRTLLGLPPREPSGTRALAERAPDGVDAGAPASTTEADMVGVADETGGSPTAVAEAALLVDDARGLLDAAHQAFEVVERRWLELGDNYALVCIDTAWAALLADLGGGADDARSAVAPAAAEGHGASAARATARAFTPASLEAARTRLSAAQSLLAELHGPGLEKLDRLAASARTGADHDNDFGQARATYVRLRLLLGVVAFHENRIDAARALLRSAAELRAQLTITRDDDASLAQLLSLGFTDSQARRALLACNKDVERAARYALASREEWERSREAARRRRAERREARTLGRTCSGALVDVRVLGELEQLGYARTVVVEALCRADNSLEGALATLTSEEARGALELELATRESQTDEQAARVAELAAAGGVDDTSARDALDAHGGDVAAALAALVGEMGPSAAAGRGGGGAAGADVDHDAADAANSATAGASAPPDSAAAGAAARRARAAELRDALDESGLVDDVREAERAYQQCDLDCEGAALQLYLSRLD